MLIFKFEELYTLWFGPFCIIMVFGIMGNVITIAKIAHDKRLHNPTYCSICCLACADLIGLIHFLKLTCHHLNRRHICFNIKSIPVHPLLWMNVMLDFIYMVFAEM